MLEYPLNEANHCGKCGREIRKGNLCICDPDYISPGEQAKAIKLNSVVSILDDIQEFLSAQMKSPLGELPGNKKVYTCLGCGERYVDESINPHHPKCWPAHMVERIDTCKKENNL